MSADEPYLTSADLAELLNEPEKRLRRWHHTGFSRHFGTKDGHNVRYSARDAAGTAVARDLVALNFPPPLAARIGASVVHDDPEADMVLVGSPADIAMINAPPGSGIATDRTVWRVPSQSRATISIPVGRLFTEITRRVAMRGSS